MPATRKEMEEALAESEFTWNCCKGPGKGGVVALHKAAIVCDDLDFQMEPAPDDPNLPPFVLRALRARIERISDVGERRAFEGAVKRSAYNFKKRG